MKRFNQSQPRTVPFSSAERTSTRAPTRDDYAMPAAWVGMGGLVAFVVVLLGYHFVCAVFDLRRAWTESCLGSLLAGALIAAAVYVFLLAWSRGGFKVLYVTETIVGADLDGDGHVGQPVYQASYEIDLTRNTMRRPTLPAPNDAIIRAWANAALNGQSTSFDTWQSRFGGRPQYREFRDAVCAGGLADERGTHSIELTDMGRETFLQMLDVEPPAARPMLEG